jgi:hypothetical protein
MPSTIIFAPNMHSIYEYSRKNNLQKGNKLHALQIEKSFISTEYNPFRPSIHPPFEHVLVQLKY